MSSSSNGNLLNPQPVTQTIIPQSDTLLQRTIFTSATTSLQQPQFITVNAQAIKTEITGSNLGGNQPTIISAFSSSLQNPIQLKPSIK